MKQMTKKNDHLTSGMAVAAALLVLGWASMVPMTLHAQSGGNSCSIFPGDKTVYGSAGVTNAHDYIDASVLIGSDSADVCYAINAALIELEGTGSCNTSLLNSTGVIDARGIVPQTGGNFDCGVNPWIANTTANVTVLLPAGTIGSGSGTGGNSGVTTTWVLPTNTHLVGEGASITTLKFNLSSGNSMIQMGKLSTNGTCPNDSGIVIEHLGLNNAGSSGVSGITNIAAQELNYVNDVALAGINGAGTGLMIVGVNDGNLGCANNSGPYSNIYFTGSGTCVNINGTNSTRGIHGLHCVGTGSPSGAAIKLDGHNNTIQDVSISGYTGDGIVIGSQGAYAQDNLIFNVTATGVNNVVHISNATGAPTDLTLMGISGGTNAIQDDVAGSTITSSPVALYVLGEAMGTAGYSRFTTSKSLPAWFVGSAPKSSGACPSGMSNGSLYSVTAAGAGAPTLSGCVGGNWVALSGSH
jgi:hypothetical protein